MTIKQGPVGTPEIAQQDVRAGQCDLAVVPTDLLDGNSHVAVAGPADDGIAAQNDLSNSGPVVEDGESNVHEEEVVTDGMQNVPP